MSSVGIRNLKNKLSLYMRKVKEGEILSVTERGRTIAYITPALDQTEINEIQTMILNGLGTWKGGKPKGAKRLVQISGKPVSEYIVEERR